MSYSNTIAAALAVAVIEPGVAIIEPRATGYLAVTVVEPGLVGQGRLHVKRY
jgi:hypothetical protein